MSERSGSPVTGSPGAGLPNAASPGGTGPFGGVLRFVFDEYPHCGRRAGECAYDGSHPAVERAGPDRLAALRAELDALAARLPPDAETRADLGTARKVLDAELFEIETLGQRFRGPLELLAESDPGHYLKSSCAARDRPHDGLLRHLRGLPGLFATAARVLPADLPAGVRMRGIERANAQAAAFAELGARSLGAGEDADVRLAELSRRAAAGARGYAQALADTVPGAGVHGPRVLAAHLDAVEGLTRPVPELVEETEAEIAGIARRIGELTRLCGAGTPAEAYALLTGRVSDGSVVATFRSAVDRLEAFWREQGTVPVPALRSVDVRLARSRLSGATIVLDMSGPLGAVAPSYVVRIPSLPDGAGEASPRRLYLNDPMLELAALHEVYAGHFVHTEAAFGGTSLVRSCLRWWNGLAEGWAHYAEELAVESGLADGRPLVELAQQRLALEYATRLWIFLTVQSRASTFQHAVRHAGELCGWSVARATREVLIASSEPACAMYTLGKFQVRAWRREAGAADSVAGLRALHERILAAGYAPLSVVGAYQHDRASEGAPPDRRHPIAGGAR